MKRLFLLLALLMVLPLAAQWSNDSATNTLIGNIGGEEDIPKICTTPDGGYWIAWFSNENGNYNVRAQLLDSDGSAVWTTPILVSSHTQMTWLTEWQTACDPNGNLVLVFQDTRYHEDCDVIAYCISRQGNFLWGQDGVAITNDANGNMVPMVTITNAGNTIISWQISGQLGLAKLNPQGQILYNERLSSPTGRYMWPQLIPVGTDDFIMKYYEDTGVVWAPTRSLYAMRYNSSLDNVWVTPAAISTQGGITAWTQILSMEKTPDDGFWICWNDDRDQNNLSSVFAQRVNADGTTLLPDGGVEVATTANRQRFYSHLTYNATQGAAWVFWAEQDADQNTSGLYAQKIDAQGTVAYSGTGEELFPMSAMGTVPEAAFAIDSDVICFYSRRSGGADRLEAIRLSSTATPVWDDVTTVCSRVSTRLHPEYVGDDTQFIVTWSEDRGEGTNIYAQNLLPNGDIGFPAATGSISGTVQLSQPSDVTQVVITAGTATTSPDTQGHWSITLPVGDIEVSFDSPSTLIHLIPWVHVAADSVTSLGTVTLLPSGVQGVLALSGGEGQITNIVISSGSHQVNPAADGSWFLPLPRGIHQISISLGGYTPLTLNNVDVTGQTVVNTGQQTLQLLGNSDATQASVPLSIYPNPFSQNGTIRYAVPKAGQVRLVVCNVKGQVVRTLVSNVQSAGMYNVNFDGKDDSNRALANGVYFTRLQTDGYNLTGKLLLMK